MHKEKKLLCFIGTPGSGKTTTLAKIASSFLKENKTVEIIVTDRYNMGSCHFLESVSSLFEINFTKVFQSGKEEVLELINRAEAEYILLHTRGISHNDVEELKKLKSLFEDIPYKINFTLVISATIKDNIIDETMDTFNIVDYQNVIITKTDKCPDCEHIIKKAKELNKAISHYTNGQRIPNDIRRFENTKKPWEWI